MKTAACSAILLCTFAAYPASTHAVLSYTVTDLGTLGGAQSIAFSINNAGQVTGYALTASNATHAFLYSAGTMNDIGTLGGSSSVGFAINDSGQITGDSAPSGDGNSRAFSYESGPLMNLGTLPGSSVSHGFGINNAGMIVGESSVGTAFNGFFYSNGIMTGIPLFRARDINNSDVIAGS